MQFWRPEPDTPYQFDWWLPLIRAGRRALEDEVPWLILLDEWELVGSVQRKGRPDIWTYLHRQARGELPVDMTGQAYKFIANRRGPSPGRFTEIDIRTAIWGAGVPHVNAGIWFSPPPPRRREDEEAPWPTGTEMAPPVRRLYLVR